ncbi:MAG: efflux RND transporter periplasmic adaptor subunit [Nitrospirae bacterium]|nr:MAG: efflux RND transporter periplasmic adaptor subunit [Nitrospirota bacterium]
MEKGTVRMHPEDKTSAADGLLPETGGPVVTQSELVPAAEPLRPLPVSPAPRPPLRKRLRWGVLLSIAGMGIFAGLALWWWLASDDQPIRYKTSLVDRGPISAFVTATGTVNPVISVQVGSQVSGKIKMLYADFNSEVTQGQVIAQIDPAIFQSRVSQARASLRNANGALVKAQTALAQRKLELDRMTILRRQEFVTQADLDLAKTNFRDAEAQVEIVQAQLDQAQAALSNAELDLGYTTIYSPVKGIVVSRNVDVGQTVAASLQAPTLFVIAQDLTKMQVDANVSESDIGGVAEGKEASFTVDAYPKEPFTGRVTQVRNAPISIQNVVTYDVVIEVDNRALKLKPGMTANVSIVTARKDEALRVPNAALRFKPVGTPIEKKKTDVWLLDSQGRPQAASLKIGIADAQFTEVLEGQVRQGDAVIVGLEASEGKDQKNLPPGFGMGPQMR